ncbi:281_t:CDS:2 [Funneliformis caledonium]|uniref:281_t:CDS:1 n=1 Tax=Funneliformis caledonium TaxID=1117310 RepID=A0A9N8VUU0_9GLOM|nr:281_t:CDS:2 [Funneliformis caledonium]
MLIKEDIRQKATKLYEDFQQTWKSSRTTEYFKQLEIRYQTKRKLEVTESQKIIELAEIDRMKVSQLRNNTESVTKHVSDSFVEFTQENTRIQKRTLESSFSKKKKPDDENAGYAMSSKFSSAQWKEINEKIRSLVYQLQINLLHEICLQFYLIIKNYL